jgi:hypothetical protein
VGVVEVVGVVPVEEEPPGVEPEVLTTVPDVVELEPEPPLDPDGADDPPELPHDVGSTGTGVGATPTVPCRVGPEEGGRG